MLTEERKFVLDAAMQLVRIRNGDLSLAEATRQAQAAYDSLGTQVPTTAMGHLSAAFLILDRKNHHSSVALRAAKDCVGKAHVELVRYKNLYGEKL